MAVRFETNGLISLDSLKETFEASGLKRSVGEPPRLGRMLARANFTITPWDGVRLVGSARALTDFAFCAHGSDVGVRGGYPRGRVGRETPRALREALGEEVLVPLLANPTAKDYYAKLGFERADNAWKIKRAR